MRKPSMRTLVVLALGLMVGAAGSASADTVFSQDFEAGLGALESTGGLFVINGTGFGNNGTLMMGHATTYTDNEYSYYEITGLSLVGFTGSAMTFDYVGSFETHFDRFNVLVSTVPIAPPAGLLLPTAASDMQFIDLDHDHHPNLGQFAYDTSVFSGGTSGVAEFDLSAFDGLVINIRFQFGSDSSVVFPGYNMDNLLITGTRTSAVPEPSSMVMACSAVAILGGAWARRRWSRRQA